MRVEYVHVLHAKSPERLIDGRHEMFFGGSDTIRPRPHLITRLRGNDQLVSQPMKVELENFAKVLFGASVRRAVHVSEVEMRDASVKRPADDGSAVFEDIDAPKILPHANRNRRQHETAEAARPVAGVVITGFTRSVQHFCASPCLTSVLPGN